MKKILLSVCIIILMASFVSAIELMNPELKFQYLNGIPYMNERIDVVLNAAYDAGELKFYIDDVEKSFSCAPFGPTSGCSIRGLEGKGNTLKVVQVSTGNSATADISELGWVSSTYCIDSDGGLNYSEKGKITQPTATWSDECFDNTLFEYYCENNEKQLKEFECQYGCSNGACLTTPASTTVTCTDSDDGKNYYVKGYVTASGGDMHYDFCDQSVPGRLYEQYCSSPGSSNENTATYQCPDGCSDGACIEVIGEKQPENAQDESLFFYFYNKQCPHCKGMDEELDKVEKELNVEITREDITKNVDLASKYDIRAVPSLVMITKDGNYLKREGKTDYLTIINWIEQKDNAPDEEIFEPEQEKREEIYDMPDEPTQEVTYICNGCVQDTKCYPMGYRKQGKFCSDSQAFILQYSEDAVCDNNFECESNVCISGKCISPSLIDRIIEWLKSLFS